MVHVAAAQGYLSILVGKSRRYGVEFTQCPWLHPFINFNTSMRQQTTSPFAETFYNLMANSYFATLGKLWRI
ncbi:hypothetical protein ACHWQZ_G002706 [Mnemiopsis leidyi]